MTSDEQRELAIAGLIAEIEDSTGKKLNDMEIRFIKLGFALGEGFGYKYVQEKLLK